MLRIGCFVSTNWCILSIRFVPLLFPSFWYVFLCLEYVFVHVNLCMCVLSKQFAVHLGRIEALVRPCFKTFHSGGFSVRNTFGMSLPDFHELCHSFFLRELHLMVGDVDFYFDVTACPKKDNEKALDETQLTQSWKSDDKNKSTPRKGVWQ